MAKSRLSDSQFLMWPTASSRHGGRRLFCNQPILRRRSGPLSETQHSARTQREYTHCEVEVHSGGQPLYYYIISVEWIDN